MGGIPLGKQRSGEPPGAVATTVSKRQLLGGYSAELLALALMLFQVLNAIAIAVTPVVANELTDTYRLSGSQVGLLSSLYMLMFCVGGIPMGMAAARWGGRVMAVGVCLMAAGFALFALSGSYGGFVAARLVQGLGASVAVPVANTLISHAIPPEKQGRALGIFGTGLGIGYLFALAVLPSLEDAGGYSTVFLVLTGAALLVGVLAFLPADMRSLPSRVGEEGTFRGALKALRRAAGNLRLWAVAVINTAASATAVTLLAWTPSFLEKHFDASLAVAAYLTAGVAAAQLVGNPLGAMSMGRWGKLWVMLASLVGMTVLTAVLPVAPVIALCFLIVVIAGFFSMSIFPAVIGAIADVAGRPDQVGPATGFAFLLNMIGLMIPPWLFGKLLDVYGNGVGQHGYLWGYLMLAAFPFAGMLATLAYYLMDRPARDRARSPVLRTGAERKPAG